MPISNDEVRAEFKEAQGAATSGSSQAGGGPGVSDQDSAGGSSGEGGYGGAQNQAFHQGQTGGPDEAGGLKRSGALSRGEEFDVAQGGGRSDEQVDAAEDLGDDQRAHQDQGQGYIASKGERDTGATGGSSPGGRFAKAT